MSGELRCEKTGNPVGTDTWARAYSCDCTNCLNYAADGTDTSPSEQISGEAANLAGEIAYALTQRMVIDMPTARAAVDEALRALTNTKEDKR